MRLSLYHAKRTGAPDGKSNAGTGRGEHRRGYGVDLPHRGVVGEPTDERRVRRGTKLPESTAVAYGAVAVAIGTGSESGTVADD
jgi:hypothetical protein